MRKTTQNKRFLSLVGLALLGAGGAAQATPIVTATIDYNANEIHYNVENPDNDLFTYALFSDLGIPESEIVDYVTNTGIGEYGYNGVNEFGVSLWGNGTGSNQKDIIDILLTYDDSNINELDIPLNGNVIITSGNQIGNCYNGAGWCIDYTIMDITDNGNGGHSVPAPGPLPLTLAGLAAFGYARKKGYLKKE